MRRLPLLLLPLLACTPTAPSLDEPTLPVTRPDAGIAPDAGEPVDAGTADCTDSCELIPRLCPGLDASSCEAGCTGQRVACLAEAGFDCLALQSCLEGPVERPFSTGPFGTGVKSLAGPVTLSTNKGTWDLARWWTGRSSVVFLFDAPATAALFAGPLSPLLDASGANVTYVFGWLSDEAGYRAAKSRWQQELAGRTERTWDQRVLFVDARIDQTPGWIGQMMAARNANPLPSATNERWAFAIDRTQRIRAVGMLQRLGLSMDLALLAHESEAFERELATDARLAEEGATVVTLATAQTAHDTIDVDATLPDPTGFDTLEVDLALDCPDHLDANCGAWDYLSHLRLCSSGPGADGGTEWTCDRELARWITTYWREGRWVTDISAQLAVLPAGPVHLRWTANGQWDPRSTDYIVSLALRYSSQARGLRPVQATPLWTGGDWNASYDASKPELTVDIPADAKKVELVTLTTGHGGVSGTNCAEFCDHRHVFSVNGVEHTQAFPGVQSLMGCEEKVAAGVVPNQFGTWTYGRGGWCPGQDVAPWVQDVTADVTRGQPATLRYRTTLGTQPVSGSQGNIVLSSWLVIWK